MHPGTTRVAQRAAWMLCFLLLTAAAGWAQSGKRSKEEQKSYWVLDHVETTRSQDVPIVVVSENGTVYSRTTTWSKLVPNQHGAMVNSVRSTDNFQVTESWSSPPQRIEFGKEGQITVDYSFNSAPGLDEYNHRYALRYQVALSAIVSHPSIESLRYVWTSNTEAFTPFIEGSTSARGVLKMDKTPAEGQLQLYYSDDPNYHPDGSWQMLVYVWTSILDDNKFGADDLYSDDYGKYKSNLEVTRRYWYRFEGPDYKIVEEEIDGSGPKGEFDGLLIPLAILGLTAGAAFIVSRKRRPKNLDQAVLRKTSPEPEPKKDKKKNNKKKDNKKKPAEEEPEEEPYQPPSTYQIIFWKDFEDALVLDDPPVVIGARVEEITPEGVHKERPDMTRNIWISGEEHCTVTGQKFDGRYMTGKVTAQRNPDESCPETATVLVAFNGPKGRLLTHVHFQVEDAAAILVDPQISFAAGEGKTLFTEFLLYGAASSPEGIEITLDKKGYEHFTSELEQDEKNPDLFRIHLTEFGKDEDLPGTVEDYLCRIEVKPRMNRPPVVETFHINRIHLGLRVELQALKAFAVELESTFDHDILPPRGSSRRVKPAESRIDMQLVVVDEEHDNKIGPVKPDKGPVFTFEDVLEGSTLFTKNPHAGGAPSSGDYYLYEDLYFRDPEGKDIGSPCQTLNFKYEFRDWTKDGVFWGVIRPTGGFLVSPNRCHAKVTVSMEWHGQEFKKELVVPLNSQPYRIVDIPPGGDLVRALARYEDEDLRRKGNLIDIRRKIVVDTSFRELAPLFYKLSVMIEGHDTAFGFDDADYNGIMSIYDRYCQGKIGTAFTLKHTVSADDEDLDAAIATIAAMDRSIPVIVLRIGLGIVTAGASEVVWTPVSTLAELKEYVYEGGDSVWGGFAQVSVKIIAWEAGFALAGAVLKRVAKTQWVQQVKQKCAEKVKDLGRKLGILGENASKAHDAAKANRSLASRKPYSSAPRADRIAAGANKTRNAIKEATQMGDDAIRNMRQKPLSSKSIFAESCAKRAREDGQKIVENFKNVMNNPTATKEEIRRATLALQGNKAAQNILRSQPSDMLRASFNAEMRSIYKEVDEIAVKRLQQRLKVIGIENPEIRIQNATGNVGDDLLRGRKIAADRDATFQFKNKKGQWVDLNEEIMKDAYGEAFNQTQYNFIPTDRKEMLKTLTKNDQALVNGAHGLESYGDDLGRIIDPTRATEKLLDANRVADAYVHKCKEWLKQGASVKEQAEQLMARGFHDEATRIMGYGETLVEEGVRQNVKQFKRILIPRMEAAAANGVGKDYTRLMAKMRVLESMGTPPPAGAISITLEEARVTLETQFGTTIEKVIEECGQAVRDVNAVL